MHQVSTRCLPAVVGWNGCPVWGRCLIRLGCHCGSSIVPVCRPTRRSRRQVQTAYEASRREVAEEAVVREDQLETDLPRHDRGEVHEALSLC